jgi:hypothetical protein
LVEIENILPVNRLQFWAGKPSIYNNNNNNNVEYKKKIKRIRSNSWRNNKFLFSFCFVFFKGNGIRGSTQSLSIWRNANFMLRCCPPFRQTIQMRKKKEKKKKSNLKKNNDELKKKKRESCERNMTETHQTRQR